MNFRETLDYLYGMLPMYQRDGATAFKKDLSNTLALCEKLGNPQDKFPSIHIAGTNGKGSSAHMISAILQAAGYKTGLYTSPHLKRFSERIRIDGIEASESYIVEFVESYSSLIEDIRPSFFELTVAMAFDYFATNKVDIAIIEVGLGGRLDSTNVITPLVSLITNISLDHTDMLGNSLKKIAFEKAGIIKPHVPVVIGEDQPKVLSVFEAKALENKTRLHKAFEDIHLSDVRYYFQETILNIKTKGLHELSEVKFDLPGNYQTRNIPGVLKTIDLLDEKGFVIFEDQLRKGLRNVRSLTGLKGRWQCLGQEPRIVCDTVHNLGGIEAVMEHLTELKYEKLHIVWGMVKDKNTKKILEALPVSAEYYFCQADIPRALDSEKIRKTAIALGRKGNAYQNVSEALSAAKSASEEDDMIFVGGSNFIIAEIPDL